MTAESNTPGKAEIREAIVTLATERGAGKTICPSEVARHVAGADEKNWRPLMPSIRTLATELVAQGKVDIKKGGKVVDPQKFEGIYRIAIRK